MFGWLFKKPSEIKEAARLKREEERRRREEANRPRSYDAVTGLAIEPDSDFAMAAAMGGQVYYDTVIVPALSDTTTVVDTPAVEVTASIPLPAYEAPVVTYSMPDTTTSSVTVTDTTPSFSSPPPASYDSGFTSYDAGSSFSSFE